MKIKILPYYCPHCGNFKSKGEIYHSSGRRKVRGKMGIVEEGWLPFCSGCDRPVYETKPVIERAIEKLFESEDEE